MGKDSTRVSVGSNQFEIGILRQLAYSQSEREIDFCYEGPSIPKRYKEFGKNCFFNNCIF